MNEYFIIPEDYMTLFNDSKDEFFKTIQEKWKNESNDEFPQTFSEYIDFIRFEKYNKNAGFLNNIESKSKIKKLYYLLRPFLPIYIRKYLQKLALINRTELSFPVFPNDYTIDLMYRELVAFMLNKSHLESIPFIWFWPSGKKASLIITHDVETKLGLEFSEKLGKIDKEYGFSSSFELIPENRYRIEPIHLERIKSLGHEVCIHDLNHDGHLFKNESVFLERLKKVKFYMEKLGAIGFRSAIMYRNIDWFKYFDFSYDMSVPNIGHLDPQFGGCCTVMPYFISSILELPLTTIQDYPMYFILKENPIDFWKKQVESIYQINGLISFNIHPDYNLKTERINIYKSLLEYLKEFSSKNNLWQPLPKEVFQWWKLRSKMKIVKKNKSWIIEGEGSEDARIALVSLKNNELSFEIR